ncbi:MAG: CbiX/SirB N-terminal domain-containing protein [Acidobacteriota bacterium]|nr:CbiX/SirB N-terminal domain-containing protein [Acidobacteriota bacterium]
MSPAETAFVLFAHGSRIESANDSVRSLAAQMAATCGHPVDPAFLELGQPDLSAAVAHLSALGAARVIVIPYFLTLGTHLRRDLPRLAREAAGAHPDLTIEVLPPLDGHPALLRALLETAAGAL